MAILNDYRIYYLLYQCGFVDPTEVNVDMFDVIGEDDKVFLIANKDRNSRISIRFDDTPAD